MLLRRWGVAAGIGIAILLVGLVVVVRHQTVGYWGRLRAEVARFEPPDGYRMINALETGTTFCIVSCSGSGEAEILATFKHPDVSEEQACADVRRSVLKQYPDAVISGPTKALPNGRHGCAYAGTPRVGSRAFLQSGECPNVTSCFTITFSSGIE